ETLADYNGTVVLISHDRDFLDRAVTSVLVPEGDGRWTEYAGGYADMLAQRGADLARRSPESKGAAAVSPPEKPKTGVAPTQAQRKLSFKDKHALETLPGEIAALEAKQADLAKALADPDLYARNRDRF